MSGFESLKITGFDHLEFAVSDLDRAAEPYLRLGFEKAGSREILERKLRSCLLVQNNISIMLSQSSLATDPVARFVATHGDGVISVAFHCEDAVSALEIAVNRGAEMAEAPKAIKKDFGSVQLASIKTFGDVRHTFISREGTLFSEGFDIATKSSNRGFGLTRIDHLTCTVEKGQLDKWSEFYNRIFGLNVTRSFEVNTGPLGMRSLVMESPDGNIRIPINVPNSDTSKVQEFLNINHGPGIQHAALATENIIDSLRIIRKQATQFIDVPATYYDSLPSRVPGVAESITELSELGILADGDSNGYLLQVYMESAFGPFICEIIQRKGSGGLGEAGLSVVLEAIEKDKVRRGILK